MGSSLLVTDTHSLWGGGHNMLCRATWRLLLEAECCGLWAGFVMTREWGDPWFLLEGVVWRISQAGQRDETYRLRIRWGEAGSVDQGAIWVGNRGTHGKQGSTRNFRFYNSSAHMENPFLSPLLLVELLPQPDIQFSPPHPTPTPFLILSLSLSLTHTHTQKQTHVFLNQQ